MFATFWRQLRPTSGERHLAGAYLVVAAFGAILALAALPRLGHPPVLGRGLSAGEIWLCIAGAIGAPIGLYLARHRLGRPGFEGLLQALVGLLLVSFAGSLIAGTIALPIYGTMFGPFTLVVTLAAAPLLAGCWAVTILAAHAMIGAWRIERDSLFRDPPRARAAAGRRITPPRGSSGLP